MISVKMGDSSNEKVRNHMSPKVVLRRLDIPLNGTIKVRDITNPGNSKSSSFSNDEISILTDIVEKVPKDSKADNTPVSSTDQKVSASTSVNDVSVKTKNMPSHVVVKNLLPGSKIKVPSNAVIKMISSGNNVKKLTSGMLIKKLPPGAVIKKVPSGILVNKMPVETKTKLMPVETTVNKVVSDNVIRNGTFQIPSKNIVIMNKCLDSEGSNVQSESCNSEKEENEIVTPIVKSVTVKSTDLTEEETLNESDVLKSDGINEETISDRVCVKVKSEQNKKPFKVLSMNGNDPLIRKMKKQSVTNTLTPVRISARLKNRKEKFSVKKLLDGADNTDRLSTKKRKPRQVANMPLSMNINNLTSTIHMTKSQLVKTFLAAREKLLVNKEKPKCSKSNTIKHLDFSVELGPEITITRVKNNKSGLLAHKKKQDIVSNDIITITEGKQNKKKVNSVSKVTQTYSSNKLREDKNNLSSTSENNADIKSNSADLEHENDTDSVKSPELIKQTNTEVVESEICVPEIKESLKPKQQKKFLNQPSSDVSLKEQFKQPGQSTIFSHGKKMAKVTPLRQNRTPEISTKIKPVKLSKIMTKADEDIPNIDETSLPMKSDRPQVKIGRPQKSPVKRKSEDNFEKYFITKTRICEHNDSLESESEEEVEHLSHFINMKDSDVFPPQVESEKNESQVQESTKGTSIYDLIQDISLELPAWNLHILQDTNSFCIAHVARGPVGIPVMKKIIEIDTDYNAKVYVNQAFRSEFHGVYNSYESIKNLILTLDQL